MTTDHKPLPFAICPLPSRRVVPAQPNHVYWLADNMRQADRDELAAASGRGPFAALRESLASSVCAWTGVVRSTSRDGAMRLPSTGMENVKRRHSGGAFEPESSPNGDRRPSPDRDARSENEICPLFSVLRPPFYKPVCMFGVSPLDILGGTGSPWLLGTNKIEKYAKTFLQLNKFYLSQMLELFPHLVNYVDARNTVSIRWLEWLGFRLDDEPIPYGPWKMPFYRFEMRK